MALVVRAIPTLLLRGQDPVAFCVERGRQLGFLRPSCRLQMQVPVIAGTDIVPRPVALTSSDLRVSLLIRANLVARIPTRDTRRTSVHRCGARLISMRLSLNKFR